MLVLRRRLGEGVVIQGGVTIRVICIKGGKVHLGIDAPRNVRVHREELVEESLPFRPVPEKIGC